MNTHIVTKYFGPGNRRGSRIKATLNTLGASVTIPYPYWANMGEDCHREAVKELCKVYEIEQQSTWVCAPMGKGYMFIKTGEQP
jgi:hypothetical protein